MGYMEGPRTIDLADDVNAAFVHFPNGYIAIYGSRYGRETAASLIAAAPEMLTELERLADVFGWPADHPASIIIAKARGQV